jgi:hypothetical protein
MHSFYQNLLRHALEQQQPKQIPPPPPSLKSVLSIQTLNELAKANRRANTLKPQEKTYLTTQELLQPGVMDSYKKKGFVFMRRRFLSFQESLRNPTIGTHIELLKFQEPCCYPLDSREAKKILYRLCF